MVGVAFGALPGECPAFGSSIGGPRAGLFRISRSEQRSACEGSALRSSNALPSHAGAGSRTQTSRRTPDFKSGAYDQFRHPGCLEASVTARPSTLSRDGERSRGGAARAPGVGFPALSHGRRPVRPGRALRGHRPRRGRAAAFPRARVHRQLPGATRQRPTRRLPRATACSTRAFSARRRAASATTPRSRSASALRSRSG